MWPWEHLAVGYLVYSCAVRLSTGRGPRDPLAIIVLGFGAMFPDLVDKPLAWTFGILPSGTSLGHSIVIAIPLTVMVSLVAWRLGRPAVGAAFSVGYLLHLPSDALYAAVILGSPANLGAYAWPLVPTTPMVEMGFAANLSHYLARYVALLSSPDGTAYLAAELLLLGGALMLWLIDGAPGLELVAPSRRREPDPHR